MWQIVGQMHLDSLESAHQLVGVGPGSRTATQQINQAYAVLLSSHFQGFCRDLHSECADHFVQSVSNPQVRSTLHASLVQNRKLDRGNPNPGNIGADYNRLGLLFWDEVLSVDIRNKGRQDRLEELNKWRNAIAHQDFDPMVLGTTTLRLRDVRQWRNACNQLATRFDEVMRGWLETANGVSPW